MMSTYFVTIGQMIQKVQIRTLEDDLVSISFSLRREIIKKNSNPSMMGFKFQLLLGTSGCKIYSTDHTVQ